MPHAVVTRVNYFLNGDKKAINGSKILVWGVSYKKDIGDARESAAYDIIPDLIKKGAAVDYFDPHIKEVKIEDKTFNSIEYSPEILKEYDLVLILTEHPGFDYEEIAKKSNLVVDTRNAIKSRDHKNVSSW
jgi:UDP-N-acetyl-D-glucosamine dehydrogenase